MRLENRKAKNVKWSDLELSRLIEIQFRYSYDDLARILNADFHAGSDIRTRRDIATRLYMIRKRLNSYRRANQNIDLQKANKTIDRLIKAGNGLIDHPHCTCIHKWHGCQCERQVAVDEWNACLKEYKKLENTNSERFILFHSQNIKEGIRRE